MMPSLRSLGVVAVFAILSGPGYAQTQDGVQTVTRRQLAAVCQQDYTERCGTTMTGSSVEIACLKQSWTSLRLQCRNAIRSAAGAQSSPAPSPGIGSIPATPAPDTSSGG